MDDWEQRKLGDVSPLRGGYAFQSEKFRSQGVPIIRISNILSDGNIGGNYAFYDEQETDDKYSLPDGAALLAMSGATTGKVAILSNPDNTKFYQNQRVGYFSDLKIVNYDFVSTIVKSNLFISQLSSVLVAGAQPNVSSKEIDSFGFYFPKTLKEQTKLGIFFKQLDETIALHQDAIQHQQDLKKAMLQKLFPVNGARIPTVRFATFKEEWEQRKLQEILKVNSGRDYKHLGSGSIPVYGTGGYMLSVNDKLSDKDAIGIGRKGTIDKPQYLKAPFWTVDTLFFMTPLNNFDLQFLYTMTQKINWKKMDESTGVPSLSKAVIEKINQNIPSYQEQIIIGRFFKQLDETIVLHKDAIHKLQLLKQSLLQKMFVN